jgi:hypothetical protein
MGARIPNVKPGKATIEYLLKVHTILGSVMG